MMNKFKEKDKNSKEENYFNKDFSKYLSMWMRIRKLKSKY